MKANAISLAPTPGLSSRKQGLDEADEARSTSISCLPSATAGPNTNGTRCPSEHTFRSWDGAELFYRSWLPRSQSLSGLVLLHRGHEHSGRWQETVDLLDLPEVAVFAWDARGHGRSPGERGSAPNLAAVVQDLDAFVRHISQQFSIPPQNLVVLAHSVGAVTAAAWVHDYAPPIRGLILAVPAFRVRLYIPCALALLRARQWLFGNGYVKSYVKAGMLTHDPEQAADYESDPLIFRQIAVNVLLDLHDTSTRLLKDAGAITTPTLVLAAGSDWVVKPSAQQRFFQGLSSPFKKIENFPGFYHSLFHEKERARVIAKAREFIQECFRRPAPSMSLIAADRNGFTKREYDRLCAPGSARFRLAKWVTKAAGRLSKGIALGWQTGFNSGQTLDYVYQNRAQGITALGRAIDRIYLSSIGWRGIRQRRTNLRALLKSTIEQLHAEGRRVHLVDIASGPGRYVLEMISELAPIPITAVLRDNDRVNVQTARKLAAELGLKNIECLEGDAFCRASLAALSPRPTLAIISGLFELFPSNEPIRNSLLGLADGIEPGGYLLYTNQPWHPQLEFIARVLTNREGKPWIMRRRTQGEMDELVGAAGFEKLSQLIDRWGMFSVSVARRKSYP